MSELPERPDNSSAPSATDPGNKTRDQPAPDTAKSDVEPQHKATRFDGNPNPQASEDAPSGLSPRDDTPAFLEKKPSGK
ncbi:hypothetical protein [Pollutimonas thiosulfatoxidans]|uniref:Uncharacterized protein n=1 Tax=Pollutimonas thiosulfatoxidans TaxID=2028345 RepID=A0A410GFM0_9BURK|nr:hypothetical protein [Pollutimonas thiosulfatoxidans]QAA95102.1 hypothetical protein CKA81_15470 [Pollutimonas thiosulfatoxidans]